MRRFDSVRALPVLLLVTSAGALLAGCGGDFGAEGVSEKTAALTGCRPAANQASFFVNANFGSSCVNLTPGRYPRSNGFGLPNDSISSFIVGSGVWAKFCSGGIWTETCMWGVDGSIANMWPGWNDVISSIEVYPRTVDQSLEFPSPSEVAIFGDANFAGQRDILAVGNYPSPDEMGLANDIMSSIRVGSSVKVLLCRDANFGGFCEELTNDQASLGALTIGNDTVSSMRVLPR